MSNLTIAIDKEVLKRARIRAIEEGTSVNAELRRFLENYSRSRSTAGQAIRKIVKIAETSPCNRGDRTWCREDLYDRWENKER